MWKSIVVAGLAVGCAAASAQGYFDFNQVPGLSEQPKVQIDLNTAMLGFVREAARAADPDAADAIEGIEGVRVHVYDVDEGDGSVLAFIDDASRRLESQGWQRMVYVQDDDGARVRVYVTFNEGRMAGLTVMVADLDGGSEAVFINVLGEIDPAKLGRAAAALGVGDIMPDLSGGAAGR